MPLYLDVGTPTGPTVAPGAGGLIVTGRQPVIQLPRVMRPNAGGIVVAGRVPTVVGGGGAAYLLESAWTTALGRTQAALTDGGKWSSTGTWNINGTPVGDSCTATIVGPTGLAGDNWTGAGNVLQIDRNISGWAHCVARHDTTGPYFPQTAAGQFWAWRYYTMNGTNHILTEQHAHCFWPQIATQYGITSNIVLVHLKHFAGAGGNWHLESGWGTPVPSTNIWGSWGPMGSPPSTWGTPFTGGTWYRYEGIIEWLSESTYRVHPRIYSMAGTLLYDETTWYDAFGNFTLATHQGAGGYFQLPNAGAPADVREAVRHFTVGNGQDAAGSTEVSQYYYVADVALKMASSVSDFIGA